MNVSRHPFRTHCGHAAALLRDNIDTDAIIPSREMNKVSKQGLSEGLFANWRYLVRREPNPDFVLNRPGYEHTSILLSLANFGCGSSREHAVWALAEYGIRVIVAVSFGAIFQKNCTSNDILTAMLSGETIREISNWVSDHPDENQVLVDLEMQTLSWDKHTAAFSIAESDRQKLMSSVDPITEAMNRLDHIVEFEQRHFRENPWLAPGKEQATCLDR